MNTEKIEKPSKLRKPLIVSTVLITIIICIFSGAYSRTDLGEAAGSYEKNKKAAEDQGLIFNSEQAAKLYAVPAEENAAELITSILQTPRKYHWDKETVKEADIKPHWAEFEAAVAKIEEASRRKYLIFPRNLDNPITILYPQYADLKYWVKLLMYEAIWARARNDSKSAERYLLAAAYIASVTDDEGILIANLVRVAESAIIEKELREILESKGTDPAWRDVVANTIHRLDKPYNVKRSIQLEHWFATFATDLMVKNPKEISAMNGQSSTPITMRIAPYIPRFGKANQSRVHWAYAKMASGLPADPYDFTATRAALQGMDINASSQSLSYTALSIAAPVFTQFSEALAKEVANRNVLSQAIELYKSGVDPAKGLPLPGHYRNDIDMKPMRLKKVKGVWTVYSIGPDKTDDGGADMVKQKGDWAVHIRK